MESAFEAEDEALPFWLQDSDAGNLETAPADSLMPTSGYLGIAAEPESSEFIAGSGYEVPEPYFTGAGEFAQFAQAQAQVGVEPEPALMQVQEYENLGPDLGYAGSEQSDDFAELPPIEP